MPKKYLPKLKYSTRALELLKNLDLKKFDFEKFEKYVKEKIFIVGDGYITDYLLNRKDR